MNSHLLLPGATIGILGGGQLGRMLASEARQMGYHVHVLTPDADSPAGQLADSETVASYEDAEAVGQFARGVDVITFEFENVCATAIQAATPHALIRPSGRVLHVVQNRAREKEFLVAQGIPCAPFRVVSSESDLLAAVAAIGTPAVLKTSAWGYDGKGQAKLDDDSQARTAFAEMGGCRCVLEAFVEFDAEVSAIIARGIDGEIAWYGPVRNDHKNHILDVSRMPIEIAPHLNRQIEAISRTVVESLDVVGLICIEFFLTSDGQVLVNEIAPRPHNSGHLTIDACRTSQFQQQLRAVCGLPLGSTEQVRPAAMANLLGDLWQHGTPRWEQLLRQPGLSLHLYGKSEARPGRKMGHVTALADTSDAAADLVVRARQLLVGENEP